MSNPTYISIGTGNSVTANDVFILGNNITAANANELYLDTTIQSIAAPGLITGVSTTPASYGLIKNTTSNSLQLAPITDKSINPATPTTLGTVYGFVDTATTPNGNTGLGLNALLDVTGTDNTAVGENALKVNTVGNNNTVIGYNTLVALDSTTAASASNNTVAGYESLAAVTTGSNNACVGSNFTSTVTTASNTTTLGSSNTTTATSLSDTITIGYGNAMNSATTALVLGNSNTVGSSSAVFGNNNTVTQSPNAVVFASGFTDTTALPNTTTTGTLYFDPNLTNVHISKNIPSTTSVPTADIAVPLVLDTSTGYVYQSSVPLSSFLNAYYTYTSPTAISLTATPSTVVFNNLITDTSKGAYSNTTGIFTTAIAGTYKYKYQIDLADANLGHAGTAITVGIVTTTTGSTPVTSTIQSTITKLPLVNSSTPLYAAAVTLVGSVALAVGETLQCTLTSSNSISVTATNSYMKISFL